GRNGSLGARVSGAGRPGPTGGARAGKTPPPREVETREDESSDPGLTASNPPASNTGGTSEPSASDFLVGNSPEAIAKTQSPDINGASSHSIRPLDLTPTNDATSARPPEPMRGGAIPPPHDAERNPSNPADALWIQRKLRELGYYAGNGNGV